MTAHELIELARLLVLYANYVEMDEDIKYQHIQLAIECLVTAQKLIEPSFTVPEKNSIPF